MTSAAPKAPDDDWIALSARLQRLVAQRSRRTDVVARISDVPIATPTWLGGYRHDIAEVLFDGGILGGAQPSTVDPSQAAQREQFADLICACFLAAAHAEHTGGDCVDLPPAAVAVARALEGARVARAYLHGHAADRVWIRAGLPAHRAGFGLVEAVQLVAWMQAGVLMEHEAQPAIDALRGALSDPTEVEAAIERAVALPDAQWHQVPELAREIARALGLLSAAEPESTGGTSDPAAPGLELSAVSADAAREARAVVARQSHQPTPPPRDTVDESERAIAMAIGQRIFDPRHERWAVEWREPTGEVRRQARDLAFALRRSRYRAEHVQRVPSSLPPGRHRMDELMRRDAQRAANVACTAKPWRQLRRRAIEQPPLRVGLSWDVSRSRMAFHREMAELAWILAWAMAHIEGTLAAAAWNNRVIPVTWPGRVPTQIAEPTCEGGSGGCADSIRALDGALHLTNGLGARMLIVTTDLAIGNRRFVNSEVARLTRHGVNVLWVTATHDPNTPRGALNVTASDTDAIVKTLTSAVCTTLEEAL